MRGSKKRGGIFGVAGRYASPALEVEPGVLDQVAQFVEVYVIVALVGAILFWRDHGDHSLVGGLLKDRVGVIASVGQQIVCAYSFDEG